MEQGVIDGGLLRLYLSPDDGTTYKTGYMDTSADLSISHALKETKTKDSGVWNESAPGTYEWSISGDKLYTVEQSIDGSVAQDDIILDDLLMLMIPDFDGAGQPDCDLGYESKKVLCKFATPQGLVNPGWYYEGYAYITDINISSGNDGESSTASYTLTGIGPLTKKVAVVALRKTSKESEK